MIVVSTTTPNNEPKWKRGKRETEKQERDLSQTQNPILSIVWDPGFNTIGFTGILTFSTFDQKRVQVPNLRKGKHDVCLLFKFVFNSCFKKIHYQF